MADAIQEQAIADVARQVVAEVVPEELPLFRPLSQAYFKNPQKALKSKGGGDQMLGFGATAAATMMTPLILQSTQVGLDALARRFVNHLNAEMQRIDTWLTTFASKPSASAENAGNLLSPADGVGPPPELFDQVQQIVAQQCRQLSCTPAQADQIASKVRSALATGKLAQQTLATENQLDSQIHELKIEINEMRKARDVDEIVRSEYYIQLCRRASELRQQTSRRNELRRAIEVND